MQHSMGVSRYYALAVVVGLFVLGAASVFYRGDTGDVLGIALGFFALSICALPNVMLLRGRFMPFAVFGLVVPVFALLILARTMLFPVRGPVIEYFDLFEALLPVLFAASIGTGCTAALLLIDIKGRLAICLRRSCFVVGWITIALTPIMTFARSIRFSHSSLLIRAITIMIMASLTLMIVFLILPKGGSEKLKT